MNNLPAWAQSRVCRELVAAIIASRPEPRVRQHRLSATFGGYSEGTSISYPGKLAGTLRRIFDEWQTREFGRLDSEYAITKVWDQARADEVCRAESADALIERVLRESFQARRAA